MYVMAKTQTAFRFDEEMLEAMKKRALSLNKSLNRYVTDLVNNDLSESFIFPKVKMSDIEMGKDSMYGILPIPTDKEIEEDPRLEWIWKR